jgi:hypothetical protein
LMEYCELLDKADECEDPYMRMAYASAWAVSVYFAYQRTWKPFNPILGETYEMVNHQGISFIAEQVSDITIAETFCKHLLPANDAGSTVLYCMPSIIFHFIFSGKPSSSDGCRSL